MMRYIACMALECKQLREDLQIDFFGGYQPQALT